MSDRNVEMQQICGEVRGLIIENSLPDITYHFGSALSCVEILVYLYFYILKDVNLMDKERSKVILSKGHACQSLYTILYMKGYINKGTLKSYKKFGSALQGHPDMKRVKCIDFSSGSLGEGLSVGVGMALANRIKNNMYKIYIILGDGELQEGQVWEAAMSAAKYKLYNLVCFVDCNKLQVDGKISDIMPLSPLSQKWEAFGWDVYDIKDGNNIFEIDYMFNNYKKGDKPTVFILNTIKGKGVSFMENIKEWHSNKLSASDKIKALLEIRRNTYECYGNIYEKNNGFGK